MSPLTKMLDAVWPSERARRTADDNMAREFDEIAQGLAAFSHMPELADAAEAAGQLADARRRGM